jgi:dipeptidyl aminopeptidase/acylaminoacyl peptidase
MSTLRVVSILALLIPVLASPLRAQEESASPRPVEVEDAFRLKSVGSPVISPDGEWVAYTVTTTNLEEDERETRLWMTRSDGTWDPIPMTRAGESVGSPDWSPDGRYLSFTATRGEGAKSQVWVLDRRGGEAWALTDEDQGVSSYEWSHDGSKLVLVMRDEEVKDSTWTSERRRPWVMDRLQFKRDRTGYLTEDRRYSHLYVFDVATRETRQITAGEHDESAPAWSPDGRWIAFSSNRTEDPDANSDSNLWIVAADVDAPVTEPRQITTYPGRDGSPTFSPDGTWIAYTTGTHDPRFDAFGTTHLAVVSAEGGEAEGRRILTAELDRNVRSPEWDRDGRGVVFSVSDEGETHVARVDLESGLIERLVGGEIAASGFDIGPDGRVAVGISRFDRPTEVFITDVPVATAVSDRRALVEGARAGGRGLERLRKLTAVNDSLLGLLALAEVRNIHVPSSGGARIEGWIYTPAGWDEDTRLPTLLRIHGGPNGMYGVGFNFDAQLFTSQGYAVVMMNPRGSSGYGHDFGMELWQRWGIPDVDDVMAGVQEAIDQGVADPDRLGVGGWSYGGILTNYLITRRPDVFKGAVTGASMALLVANFGHDHYQLGNEREWGLPWENRDLWERLSPFNDVEKVETPTLIMGGESDWNVPIQNSEQLYQALRRRGVPTQLVVYPGQPHGIGVPSYQVDRWNRYLAWYDRWVKGETGDRPVT